MAEYLSELTRKTLLQFNWSDGDPVPQNLGALFSQIHERSPASKTPGLYIDKAGMTDADIDVVNAALANEKVVFEKQKCREEKAAKTAGFSPEMIALQNTIEEAQQNEIQIVDDREAIKIGEPTAEQTDLVDPAESEKTADEATTNPPEVLLNNAPAPEVFCPRCNWDMRMKYDVEITQADKEIFVASVLGGTRMQKNYELMNGRYGIKFRGMTAEENKQIHRQLLIDQKNDEFQSDTEWFLRFFEYRLACSVEIVFSDNKVLAVVPELDEVENTELPSKKDNKELPALVRLKNYVVGDLLKIEITRRLVSNKFREFQRLYEALEAMALEPNFW